MSARLDKLSRQADLLNNDGVSAKRGGEQVRPPKHRLQVIARGFNWKPGIKILASGA